MNDKSPHSLFGRANSLLLVLLFLTALSIRLYDLTDLPLDFHPTRQLFSALKTRGMYYASMPDAPAEQREFAIQQGKLKSTIEPEIVESLVAFTWKFSGEELWVARIYSIFFWLIGGIFLYLLARDIFSTDGALFALAFYFFLPYAVIASRSFQPDPLMLALIMGFWWAVNRWASIALLPSPSGTIAPEAKRSGGGAGGQGEITVLLLASLLGGFAIFVKLNAAFFVIGGALGATLGRASIRDLVRNKHVWMMAVLGILPGAAYVIYGFTHGFLGQQFGGRFIPALLLSPAYPLGWANMIQDVLGLVTFALALLGFALVEHKPSRALLFGLWGGYALFGIFFNYHISTHNYYSLPLIPIAALTLTPLAELVLARLAESASRAGLMRTFVFASLSLCVVAAMWTSRGILKSTDYRPEVAFWNQISEAVKDYRVVALTQDYGSRLAYWGWTSAANWPDSSDIEYHTDLRGGAQTFEKTFARLTKNKELFLITDLADFANQPELKARLAAFAIFTQGDGFIIFDLRQPR